MTVFFLLFTFVVIVFCAYFQISLLLTGVLLTVLAIAQWVTVGGGIFSSLLLIISAVLLVLAQKSLRKKYLSRRIFTWFRSVLPAISQTEQEAIDAGTVWWDGELFSGKPNWNQLLSLPKPTFTEEEQAFLDGPVVELCRKMDNWNINHNLSNIPPDTLQFIKDNGFLGMIIPKEYGGLGFSGTAQAEVFKSYFCGGWMH